MGESKIGKSDREGSKYKSVLSLALDGGGEKYGKKASEYLTINPHLKWFGPGIQSKTASSKFS